MSAAPINVADLVWHYTTGDRLRGILTDLEIRPATAFVAADETPVVWFSTNQIFERSALKGLGRRAADLTNRDNRGDGSARRRSLPDRR